MQEQDYKHKVVGLIPARWASTRFEGKPLVAIKGKAMIQRVWERCQLTKTLDEVYVVTDDDRIENYCVVHDMKVIRVDKECITGTDRCVYASRNISGDIFVNIQGDEPIIEPDSIDAVVEELQSNTRVEVSNAYCKIKDPSKLDDVNVVKAVINSHGFAMYFSRLPISDNQQLGLYAFRKNMLSLFLKMNRGVCEQKENVEMLRILEHDYKLAMVEVDEESVSVDTPQDVITVEKLI